MEVSIIQSRKLFLLIIVLLIVVGAGSLTMLIYQSNSSNIYEKEMSKIRSEYSVKKMDTEIDDSFSNSFDWKKLKEVNSDIVGWISIKGTTIDSVIVQGTDNNFYLKHNYKKNYSYNGNIYMDYHCDSKGYSRNTVIYGHNMKDNKLFGQLPSLYNNSNSAKNNNIISVDYINEKVDYVVIGAYYTNFYAKDDNGYIFPATLTDMNNERFIKYLDELNERFIFKSNLDLSPDDSLLTLYTCSYKHYKNERFVVVARKIRAGEDLSNLTYKNNPSPLFPKGSK